MNYPVNLSFEQSGSYFAFIWKDKGNRNRLLLAIAVSILEFILFKVLYPFPDFFGDSYSYIAAAYEHRDISIWPIGYSKFLSLFHSLTYSGTALVAFQYFFMQVASLHFYYTILYFFNPRARIRNLLFVFLFINALTLYIGNTVNSDALFAALTLLWITELIWITQRPMISQLFIHAVLLFFCFTIRNTAYYYPLVTVISLYLSRQPLWRKVAGILMPFILIIPFILYTEKAAYKLTGTYQFSLFTGWQLANNALYIYDKIDVDSNKLPTSQSRELNRITIRFFKHLRPNAFRDYLESYVGNFFIRQPEAPLKQYAAYHYPSKNFTDTIWGKASADFEPFGKYIIVHHPLAYGEFFIWPNFWHYLTPPLSNLQIYNLGSDTIDDIAQFWFHYPTAHVSCVSNTLQSKILYIYEWGFLVLNLFFLGKFLYSLYRGNGAFILKRREMAGSIIFLCFIILNFAFSISATVNILRYQVVPMVILLSFTLLLNIDLEGNSVRESQPILTVPKSSSKIHSSASNILNTINCIKKPKSTNSG